MSLYFVAVRICVRVVGYDWYMSIVDCCIEYIEYARYKVALSCGQFGQLSLARLFIPHLYKSLRIVFVTY
jgi:hypothetical protein